MFLLFGLLVLLFAIVYKLISYLRSGTRNLPLQDNLPVEDDFPRVSDSSSKHVVTWNIPDFAQRYESAADCDEWASGEYELVHPTHGPVLFYFVVTPKLVKYEKSFYIFIRQTDLAEEIACELECEAWLETMDGQTSEIKKGAVRLQRDPTSGVRFTEDEMKRFFGHNKIRLCCRFPFETTQLSFLSSIHTTYEWPIENFADHFQSSVPGDNLDGPSFGVQWLPDVTCRLVFTPKESTNLGSCGISLYVSCFGNRQELPIQFDLWLDNGNRNRSRKNAYLKSFTKNRNRCNVIFRTKSKELLQLVGNIPLYVCWTIRPVVSKKETTESTVFPPHQEQTFNVAKLSDAKVRVKGRVFKVKKSILSAQSPVFNRMFSGDTKENKTGVVVIPDLKTKPVELMLRFMYSGRVENLYQWAYDLLPLADRYDVELLTETCIESIGANLNVTNVVKCLELVAAYLHLNKLKTRTFVFARKNYKEIIQLPEWKPFTRLHPDLLREFLDYVILN